MGLYKRFIRPARISVVMILTLFFFSCDKIDWYRTKQKNTIPAYEHFMKKHRRNMLILEASERLKQLHFEEVKKINTIPAYETFLRRYSYGEIADSVSLLIQKLAYEEAKRLDTLPAYITFLENYRGTAYTDFVYKAINRIYAQWHPDFRDVTKAHVVINKQIGKGGNLNEFIDLPFEKVVKDLLLKNGVEVTFKDRAEADMLLTLNVKAEIVRSGEPVSNDSVSSYGIAFDMSFEADAAGEKPVVLKTVSTYFPGQQRNISIASRAFFESAFWQTGSYPTAVTTLILKCFGPDGVVSLLDEDDRMQSHIVHALAIADESTSGILYPYLESVDRKSMAIASTLRRKADTRIIPFLSRALYSANEDFQMTAMELIKMMPDTSHVEPLWHVSSQRDKRQLRLQATEALGYIESDKSVTHLITLLKEEDDDIRKAAVVALGRLNSPAAVSRLITMFDDEDREVASEAMKALEEVGESAVDSLIKALQSSEVSTVWRAMVVLGELKAEKAVDDIIPLLTHPNSFTSWQAREVLGRFKSEKVLEAMIELLSDPESIDKAAAVLGYLGYSDAVGPLMDVYSQGIPHHAKRNIINALGRLKAAEAVGFLTKILDGDQVVLQSAAAKALGLIGSVESLPVLVKHYQNDDLTLKRSILEAYASYENPKQIHRLVKAFKENQSELRLIAIELLNDIGQSNIIDDLVYLLNDPEKKVQEAAKNKLLDRRKEAIPGMVRVLRTTKDQSLQREIIYTLRDTGSEDAVAPLIRMMNDSDPSLHSTIRTALGYLGEPSVSPLLTLLKTGNRSQRIHAAKILAMMKEPRSLPEFMKILRNSDTVLKKSGAYITGELHYYPAVPLLINCISEKDVDLTVASIIALGKIGSAQATPALLTTLESPNSRIAVESARALGNIRDSRAVSILIEKITSGNKALNEAAAEALIKTGAPAVEPLFHFLTGSNEHHIKETADILARIGKPAVPYLLTLIDSKTTAGWYAVEALGKTRDERAIKPLIEALALDDEYYFRQIKEALANIGKPAHDPVIALLESDEVNMRWKAVEIIYAFREPSLTRYFIEAVGDNDWRVRFEASKILESITGEEYGMSTRKWRNWYREYKHRWNI